MGDAQARAETYLRLLAEAALRPGTRPDDDRADRVHEAADILVDAGVLTEEQTTDLLLMLATALRVRGRQGVPIPAGRARRLGAAAVRLGSPGQAGMGSFISGSLSGRPGQALARRARRGPD